ncbi:MAG: hypothetical protein C5B46_08695 [Proteobacteria bacterium]|nr:MAG: hypothetical protein C5B46_08695 [Pseudomonadota bacterium]
MTDDAQLADLRVICERPERLVEGGIAYIFLPGIKIIAAGMTRVMDALLCPGPHNGYLSRLFLSEPVAQRGANWTQWQILGRTWHTWSWQNVPANLPLIQMVLEHLRALR